MRTVRIFAIALFAALAVSLPAAAGPQHVADASILDQAVADHVRQKADDRDTIRRLLEHEQVRELAGQVGLDLKRAEAAVATLDDAELAGLAAQARAATDALAGGQSNVTISTTWIIIGLLVLILLIVAI